MKRMRNGNMQLHTTQSRKVKNMPRCSRKDLHKIIVLCMLRSVMKDPLVSRAVKHLHQCPVYSSCQPLILCRFSCNSVYMLSQVQRLQPMNDSRWVTSVTHAHRHADICSSASYLPLILADRSLPIYENDVFLDEVITIHFLAPPARKMMQTLTASGSATVVLRLLSC